jgi:AcrR family transcriptional regulator
MQRSGTKPAGDRANAIGRRIAALDPAEPLPEERLDAIALGLVDALLDADAETVRAALGALRDVRAGALDADTESSGGRERLLGWLEALIALAHWALERMQPESELSAVARGTRAWEFLRGLAGSDQVGSGALRQLLGTDETQVSRTGRRLLERGLVRHRKVGRQVYWDLTPRGRRALELAGPPAPSHRPDSFWMEAIRRGFEGAAGDEPGPRRGVDPTRERIIESTLELHQTKGIQATTWPEIAARAGLPVGRVHEYFPTLDELIMGCGQHALSSLRLPPPERAAEVFAGARTRPERVRRLVDTLFDVYEREAPTLERGQSDRAELPLVDDSMSAVDAAIDALVTEALADSAQAPTVTGVRALTDVTIWRALRDQGASPDASAKNAAAAIDRWLEGRSEKAAA